MATKTDNDVDTASIRADIDQIREEFMSLKDHLQSLGKRQAARGRAAGKAKLDELGDELEALLDDAREQGSATVSDLERQIRDRPLMSLFVAFGIGMLISQFIGRGR
ncbi:MAG: DUF883 family protein [Geminicoccaceae bacterium]|nr:DUF883 family protein [Geminicoccaceae bacterium]MCB9942894.1 DUF883 family protein [Geminicoccaceae bacterium]